MQTVKTWEMDLMLDSGFSVSKTPIEIHENRF